MISKLLIKRDFFSPFRLLSQSFSTEKKSFGGLKDQDRIFTNLYGDNDAYISGALRRVFKIIK